MQKGIHPTYYDEVEIVCACGAKMITGGVIAGPIRVDICSSCHPFYTGEKKLVDTEGRVEKFERLMKTAEAHKEVQTQKKTKKQAEQVQQPTQRKTLREMLQEVQTE